MMSIITHHARMHPLKLITRYVCKQVCAAYLHAFLLGAKVPSLYGS